MLIRADGLAQRYGGRPSELLGVDPREQPLLAYWVDEAAAIAAVLSQPQTPTAAASDPPRRRNQVHMLGGVPVVTGVIERE